MQNVHSYILNLLPKGIASYTNTFTPIFSTYSQRGLHHIQTRSRLNSQPTPKGDCIIYKHVHAYILNLLPKGIASYAKRSLLYSQPTPKGDCIIYKHVHALILNLLPKGIASYTNTFTPIFSTYSQRGLHHIQNVHSYILNLLPKGIASYTKTFTPIFSTYFHHIQNIHAYILNLLPKGIAYTNNVKLPNSASPDNDHTIENVSRLLHITIFISRITLLIGDDTPNKTMLWLKSSLLLHKTVLKMFLSFSI